MTLACSVLGFFIITFDAVVVNVALPSIRKELGGGITGSQWVVDGYTLAFASLLLSSGVIADRIGAKRSFGAGMVLFAAASLACGIAPTLPLLVIARFVQGAGAALTMPASMALIGQAFPERSARARAIAVWAMGGAIASSSGPVLGGLLTLTSWKLIFLMNLPVGAILLHLLRRTAPSSRRHAPLDGAGLATGIVAMGALTTGAIETGSLGLGDPRVIGLFTLAAAAGAAFVRTQRRGRHPMVPAEIARTTNVRVASAVGFAFVVGYYGLPFLMSLFLQQQRGLSSFRTGLVFLPMMLSSAALTTLSARAIERFDIRRLVPLGLAIMAAGMLGIALVPADAPVWVFGALMILAGVAGPCIMPPTTAVLLGSVPDAQAGTASGLFNTSRQVGGALSIAVFGSLLNAGGGFVSGMRTSLVIAAAVILFAAAIARRHFVVSSVPDSLPVVPASAPA